MKRSVLFILLFMLLVFAGSLFIFPGQVVILPQLVNPQKFFVDIDSNKLIVVEKMKIHIYSLAGFKYEKSFGKAGEGPGEFRLSPGQGYNKINVNLHPDSILVNSMGKLSMFTKAGDLKKEIIIPPYILELKALDQGFVGWRSAFEEGVNYWLVNLYDAKINKVKEIFRMKNTYQRSEGLKLLSRTLFYETFADHVLVTSSETFKADVFDSNGKYSFSIRRDYKNLEFTARDKERLLDWLKKEHKQVYQRLRDRIYLPRYYPALRAVTVSDHIYIITYKEEGEKSECFIYDRKGKFLGRKFLPLRRIDIRTYYPYVLREGKLYQMIENSSDEKWELHIIDIH